MFAKVSKSVHSPIVHIALLLLSIQCSSSAPIETIYAKFISEMSSNKCTTPEQMKLPLNSSATESHEYLSSYLQICQSLETIQRNKEARYLCTEILDNLKVILCPPISVKVIVNPANLTLSKQVCKDIGSLKDTVPENKVILKRLTDSLNCEMMCEGVFEKACQVLLWSYQLQKQGEKSEIPNNEAKNPLQIEIKAVADETKLPEQNKDTQTPQKNTVAEQQIQVVGKAKQPSANDLIWNIQKTSTVVKQQAQNQVPEQGTDLEANTQNSVDVIPKDPNTNNILPLYINNFAGNNSLDAGSKLPKVEEIHSNDLPENDIESPNAGLADQEDPHDNEEQIPHNIDVAVPNANVEPSQNVDNKSPDLPVADETPNLPNDESPDVSVKDESHLQAKLPQSPAIEGLDPHDDEEQGEVDIAQTDPKAQVAVGETSKMQDKIETPGINNEQSKTSIQNAAITKEGSTANTMNSIATTNKEVGVDEKTSPVGETQSIDGRKTTERPSSLPSQKGVDSSVAPPANEDSSSTSPALEKMEGEDDVHEMPEDREPDQYTDLENTVGDPDDEYARQEYGGIYEPAKNKEIVPDKPNQVEVPKVDVMRPREPTFNDFSPRDKYGRQSEGLPVFPDQEDGHFFFYFLSIVLILMAGYLIFHNKQKIIALIVEGRHERRRRSHGVGYKKLETK